MERLNVALADRYRVDRELGAGGMATVYLARDLRHGRDVAIKVLDPDLAATVGADRFQREITIAARLQHPNILTVLDSGDADGQLWYAMPFVEGESLRARLAREGELSIEDAIAIAGEVAGALDHAHRQGVVHRDIKPENILFSNGHALVADFGIARVVDDATSRLTATGLAVGTPAYMSPEQATGERNAGPASDIYSLACVTFEMLTGEAPYTGANARAILTKRLTDPVPSPRRLRASITPALDREVMRGLSPTPADRQATATSFADALKAATLDTAGRPRARFRIPIAAAVLGAVIVAVLLFSSTREPDTPADVQQGISLLARRTPAAAMEAMAAFERALAADSSDAEALAGLSYTYALFADWGWEYPGRNAPELRARALDHAERAIAADSGSASAWMSRAYILTLNDPYRLDGAIASFRRSLGIDSLTAEGWYQFGQALMQLGEDSAAADAYRRAFALDPNRPMALMSLSALSLKAGRVAEAKGLIDSAVAASPTVTSPYVRVVRGRIALLQGDTRAARDEAELALALDTSYTIPARSLLVAVAHAEGDTAASRRDLERMVADAGDAAISPTTARYLAAAQISVGQLQAALSTIERARPRGAYLWFYLQSPDFEPLASAPRFQAIIAEADPRSKRNDR
jgi:tetratricopeptide (TPR) repeat protein/tRNA A-37 threonylcarbamoyl transferase component Bud32